MEALCILRTGVECPLIDNLRCIDYVQIKHFEIMSLHFWYTNIVFLMLGLFWYTNIVLQGMLTAS